MSFYDAADVQGLQAEHLRRQREAVGMSRDALAERSLVAASTIKGLSWAAKSPYAKLCCCGKT